MYSEPPSSPRVSMPPRKSRAAHGKNILIDEGKVTHVIRIAYL